MVPGAWLLTVDPHTQAADQARRAQSTKRRSTRAAQMAWDIALAPLIRRLEQQGKQQLQQRATGAGGGGGSDTEEAQRQLQQQQQLLQRVLEMQGSPSSCAPLSAQPPPGGGGGGQFAASAPSVLTAATGGQRPGAGPQGSGAGGDVGGGLKPKVTFSSGVAHGTPSHTPWDAKAAEAAAASAASGGSAVHATPGLAAAGTAAAAAGAAVAAAPGGAHGGGIGPRGGVATPAAPIPAAASPYGPYGRHGHAVHHNGGTYGQAGSSVTSTGSMLILDEHREASPVRSGSGVGWCRVAQLVVRVLAHARQTACRG